LPTSINLKVNHVSHVINDAAKYSPADNAEKTISTRRNENKQATGFQSEAHCVATDATDPSATKCVATETTSKSAAQSVAEDATVQSAAHFAATEATSKSAAQSVAEDATVQSAAHFVATEATRKSASQPVAEDDTVQSAAHFVAIETNACMCSAPTSWLLDNCLARASSLHDKLERLSGKVSASGKSANKLDIVE
jgi:hypothetical protein